CMQAIEYPNTF
nr:immunoglobulin light chain junction region [Macaca mulatta]